MGVTSEMPLTNLSGKRNEAVNSKLLPLLNSDDSTIRFWAADALSKECFADTVPVLLKYLTSADPFECSHAMYSLCHDADGFHRLGLELKNDILDEMLKVMSSRFDKDFDAEVWSAHTISDPLYISICNLAELLPIERMGVLFDKLAKMSSSDLIYIRFEAARGLAEVAKRIKSANPVMYVSIEQILLRLISDSDSSIRGNALFGLSTAASGHTLPESIKAVSDPDPGMQDRAVFLLRKYYPFTPKALRALRQVAPDWPLRKPPYKNDFKLSRFQKFLSYLPL